jgi:CRP-like cAMP-binding protein
MNDDDLRKLEGAGSQLTFEPGQILTERGTPGTGLYVVVEGQIVVETPNDGLLELGPGSVVGERALFSEDGLRQARVRALTQSVVVAVGRAEVERMCAEDPAFADRLARAS